MRIGGGAVSIADVTDREARDLGFVRDFWFNEIRAGRAFFAGDRLGASIGNLGHFQLFNPGGSGITIVVHRVFQGVETALSVTLTLHNTALTTLVRQGVNLLAGGAAGVGEFRSQVNAAQLGTMGQYIPLLARTPYEMGKDWTVELGAGEGLIIMNQTANDGLYGNFEWIEF